MNDRQPQAGIFGDEEPWAQDWRGMPEFNQQDLTPRHTIEVEFKTRADAEKFSALVEQTVTPKTRSIWYPEAEIWRMVDRRYVGVPDDGRGWDWDRAERDAK